MESCDAVAGVVGVEVDAIGNWPAMLLFPRRYADDELDFDSRNGDELNVVDNSGNCSALAETETL